MTMIIKWRALAEYPKYEINRLGQIRKKETGKLLLPFDDRRGYLRVTLNGKNIKVHILVAKTFLPNPGNLPIVNHKSGVKHDNRASQLEWCSWSENVKHAWALGLRRRRK
jgi:hypothetical protein